MKIKIKISKRKAKKSSVFEPSKKKEKHQKKKKKKMYHQESKIQQEQLKQNLTMCHEPNLNPLLQNPLDQLLCLKLDSIRRLIVDIYSQCLILIKNTIIIGKFFITIVQCTAVCKT
jgi:hypothetical protein